MLALTATSNPRILKKYLEMTLDDSIIKQQDTCSVISKIATNPLGRRMAYRYMTQHWQQFLLRYGQGINARDLVALFTGIFGTGKTEADLVQWKNFREGHDAAGGRLALEQAGADIRNHIAWLNRSEQVVVDWLKNKVGNH